MLRRRTDLRVALQGTLSRFLQQVGFGRAMVGVLSVLVVLVLLLPPVSLLGRLGIVGYETLSSSHVAASHPDGMTVQVNPESFSGRLRVRLDSVPRLAFLEGSAGSALKEAAKTLPDHLEVKSPLYTIKHRGTPSESVWIDVVVPNDAEPWEILDLYTWNGESWTWLGSDLHTQVAGHEFLRATVTEVPESVVVVQSGLTARHIGTDLDAEDQLSQVHLFDTVQPSGLLLGTMGGFAGDADSLVLPDQEAGCAVRPTLRNWAPGASVNAGLLADLLDDDQVQQAHIGNIAQLCEERDLDGVTIDYRGVTAQQGAGFTSFIEALAGALHGTDLLLGVTVAQPVLVDGDWTTGGYDLATLGQAVDALYLPFPSDPKAYADGGEAHHLLDWATAQMPRHKLHMQVSSLSATLSEATETCEFVSAEEALKPFGRAAILDEVDEVEPESPVALGLSGSLLSTAAQAEAGTYVLRHRTDAGETCTSWLGTAASLAHKLNWATRYHLGGVVVADALNPGNLDGVLDVVEAYPDVESVTLPALEEMQIAWKVMQGGEEVDGRSGPLANPSYVWTAPAEPGAYRISASVVGFNHGQVRVTVSEPQELASETITTTGTITETGVLTETAEAGSASDDEREDESEGADAASMSARFLADVTVPDNTQMDKGEVFEKTWQLENNGSRAWPDDTVLAFVGGEQMGAPESVEVPAVAPGGKKDITVEMTAPNEDGTYTGKWQLRSGNTSFGGQLWVTIVVGEPGQTAVGPGPAPAPTGGGSFELGGHIRDWGFPHANQMHYAGMNWAKVQVRYPGDASGIIAAAHASGFKIQISALGPADMVSESNFEQKIADWVAGIAAAGADAIEVWNEPNIDREWQLGHISPQAYTNLLCTAYRAIKAANPSTAVISAAPSPTGSFGGGCQPNGGNCDDLPFLQGMANAGAAQCMDYIGAHHNSGATSPSARTGHPADNGGHHHSWYFLPQTQLYYNTFGGARKLFYTEMGYASQEGVPAFSDWFAWARGTNNAQQAAWLKEAVQLSINTGMVRCIIVWNIDYVRYGYDPQDGYAIIRPGGSCPACEALHSVLGTR